MDKENHTHKDSSRPAQFLIDNIDLLPRGKALDLAMGSGQNAVYLAGKGFEVEGVDISSEAITGSLALANKGVVKLDAKIADLETNYLINKGYYDVIICFHYLQRSLIPQIKEGLKKGGMVVYETFIIDQARLFGKPRNPDFLLEYNELLNSFRELRCLRYREGVIDGKQAIASIVAEKF
jgi:tellurite methyltransferase